MRRANLIVPIALALGCATTTKQISVVTEPPGAEADFLYQGRWVELGQTPADFEYKYHSDGRGYVRVSRDGFQRNWQEIRFGKAPKYLELRFDLEPEVHYFGRIETEPKEAMVELYRRMFAWDPEMQMIVPTDRMDWVLEGTSPLDMELEDVGEGKAIVRVTKPGFEPEVRELGLGQPEYKIGLRRRE